MNDHFGNKSEPLSSSDTRETSLKSMTAHDLENPEDGSNPVYDTLDESVSETLVIKFDN